MQPALLALNAGSSNLKFSLFAITNNYQLEKTLYGQVEVLSEQHQLLVKNNKGEIIAKELVPVPKSVMPNLQVFAFNTVLAYLKTQGFGYEIFAVGHRVVHGGDMFIKSTVVNPQIITQLEIFIPLAPLHQPYNIAGIKVVNEQMPHILQVACFDTAFHATQPEIAQAYALPDNLTQIPIKRYGFHGLSYEYIAQVAPRYLGDEKSKRKIIVAHLGHGTSMCAMEDRRSIATTMGFTALEGLPMGTRCGNIDPGIILYLLHNGMSASEITKLLYKRSGLLGISKISSDIRLLLASSQPLAKKAIDIFIYRINRELGSLVAALGGLDSLIFTAGIGEHSSEIRSRLCEEASWLPLLLDNSANQKNDIKISRKDSKISVWVIPTDEELIIAQHTFNLWKQQERH